MESFVHLHVHTEFSMLDGAAKVEALVGEAARLGMPSVAMTDHGNLYGADAFYRAAVAGGVRPILGIEAYVAPGSRHVKKPSFWGRPEQRSDDVSGAGSYTHLTMLAVDATGLRNLFRLSSKASLEGFYRKPRMDYELLAEHHQGIVVTTGCPSGEVQTRLRLGQTREARAAAEALLEVFGPGNVFLELMDHGLPIERSVRDGLLEIGRDLGLAPLATNDAHYVTAEQADAHAALLCVQSGKTLSDPSRFRFDGSGYHLRSPGEMRDYWDREVPGAADNTLLVAERVSADAYDEVFAHRDRMPVFGVPEGYDEGTWLRHRVEQGLTWRFPGLAPEGYRERLEIELAVIIEKGFPAYFLIVADLIDHAREVGIRVGPGRGSAAGSLVAYVLGITNIDPIPQKLLFERFLNPERASMPDIDIDFDDRRRGEMIRYATEAYGADRVAQVITFGTIKTKAALKDAARVHFGQPGFALADEITKALPAPVAAVDIPLSGIVDPAHERYPEAAEVRARLAADPQARTVFDTARGLEGLVRNAGVHACAVIMSKDPLIDTVPLWARDDGAVITGWDYPSCESVGLLKMDFLGLRNLTVIGDAIDNIRSNRGHHVDLDTLAMDDPATYELLARGDTLGVFQLDGGAMRDLLRRMRPTCFDDIVAVSALYRPGPMAMNAHNDYADRKNARQDVVPIHPELAAPLADILADTFGLIVYQEHIMHIAQAVAGYSMGRADVLRRAMGKKKKSVLEKEFEGFHAGMSANGYSDQAVRALWDTVLPFAGYAYNKSHAAAYGLVSYWTAHLKANYPAEYMAALLTSVGDKQDKSTIYLAECRRLGVTVLPPDVNESIARFAAVGDDVRFGLGAVRNIGGPVVDSILATRTRLGKATSFPEFLEKSEPIVCHRRVIASLIKAGAFDAMGHTRRGLHDIHEPAVDAVATLKRQRDQGQYDLFAAPDDPAGHDTAGTDRSGRPGAEVSLLAHLPISHNEYPRRDLLAAEREMLGLYVSGHPLDGTEATLRRHAPTTIGALLASTPQQGGEITLAGLITSIERRVNKKGEPWAILAVEDLEAATEVLVFPRTYAGVHAELTEDIGVVVAGRVNWREDRMSIIAGAITPVELTTDDEPLHLRALAEHLDQDTITELGRTLDAHPGPTPVRLELIGHRGSTTYWALDRHSVRVTGALTAELRGIAGVTTRQEKPKSERGGVA